ncbi:hypothetical protein H8356DRAFT_1359601 [Neocallimastix lanati (nom. inval.)]|nr:hypothetical protein H8356DRAFT_1359601 [Neocallimastix sp. JGI-2020a]
MSWTDIHHTVCQRCSLFPFIFNLFIYDVLDNCYKYGIMYSSDITTKQGIKGTNYNKSNFIHFRNLFSFNCKYTNLNLGFN